MKNDQLNNLKTKALAIGLSLILTIAVLAALEYVAEESFHVCHSPHCSVCMNLEIFKEIINRLEAVVGLVFLAVFLVRILSGRVEAVRRACVDCSLIALNIRMNN